MNKLSKRYVYPHGKLWISLGHLVITCSQDNVVSTETRYIWAYHSLNPCWDENFHSCPDHLRSSQLPIQCALSPSHAKVATVWPWPPTPNLALRYTVLPLIYLQDCHQLTEYTHLKCAMNMFAGYDMLAQWKKTFPIIHLNVVNKHQILIATHWN